MAKKIKIPSLQHLSRNWHTTPDKVCKALLTVAERPPTFTYAPLYSAVCDLLVLNHPYEQVKEGIKRGTKREKVRNNFLEILPLLWDHFNTVKPQRIQAVKQHSYPAGRGLFIPFSPPLVYVANGKLTLPWLSFWKNNPLDGDNLALFVSIVRDIMSQDPDLDTADFQIVDFGAPAPKQPRALSVVETGSIRSLTKQEITEMLEIFVEGYFRAVEELQSARPSAPKGRDDTQPDLF